MAAPRLKKVVVANRGEISARIIRALRKLNIESVALYSEADKDLPYVHAADASYCIGAAAPLASYLNQDEILRIIAATGADGVHPGYGFLSENAGFAERVEAAGACFIGPSPRWIRALGHKTSARDLMRRHGLAMPGSSGVLPDDIEVVSAHAELLGFPVLIKPAAGGGGIGMTLAKSIDELPAAWHQAKSIVSKSFECDDLYLERFLKSPRHIEFQFLADRYGNVRALYERDCSSQRRYQKIIEEAPASGIDRVELDEMAMALERILAKIGYDVIGTVETLYEPGKGFSFLEINTRLQVEHAVTEEVTGVDIVAAQILLASGEHLETVLPDQIAVDGHAIEARIYAEDPVRFFPSPGMLKKFNPPTSQQNIRIETGYAEGIRVTSHYDPLVAKVISHAATRSDAIRDLIAALHAFEIEGIKTNVPLILKLLSSAEFEQGQICVNSVQTLFTFKAFHPTNKEQLLCER